MSALVKLKDGIMDLTEVEVLTFTGDLKAVVAKDEKEGDLINWSEVISLAKVEGTVKLVAATKVKIDGDSWFYVAENAPEDLKNAHIEATAAAQEYRIGVLQAFASLRGITVPSA